LSGALGRVRPGRRRLSAVAVALGAHVFFLAALLWQGHAIERRLESTAPIAVQLLRLPPPSKPFHADIHRTRLAPSPTPVHAVAPEASAPTEAAPSVPETAPTPLPRAAQPDIGAALRAGAGCGLTGSAMTADERRRCEERFLAGDGSGKVYATVDPAQRAYFDASAKRALWWQEPFLATDPKNGCRPKVTNHQGAIPGGRATTSDWRVQMGCAVSF
jgi:hypothetical protein